MPTEDTAAVAVTVGRLPFAAKLLNDETGGRALLDVETAAADAEITGRFTDVVAGPVGTLFIIPGMGMSAGQGSS